MKVLLALGSRETDTKSHKILLYLNRFSTLRFELAWSSQTSSFFSHQLGKGNRYSIALGRFGMTVTSVFSTNTP
jgi:hypothetical protein